MGQTEHPTVRLDPDFLVAELVENLMLNSEWNDLLQTPVVLGECKMESWKAGLVVEAGVVRQAGRSRPRCKNHEAAGFPALGQQLGLPPPTPPDLKLGLYSRAQDD